jgi:peptide/nickel transport system substrate-binding protein
MRPVSRRTLLGGAFGLAATAALAACGSSSGNDGDSTSGAVVLRWVAAAPPSSWDPVVSGSGAQFRMLALAYAALTEIDDKGNAQPGLAKSWTYNTKGDAITFHLRPNLTFTDGSPVNAAAVKTYIERAQKQANSAIAGDLTSIKSITADSATDVTLHLTQTDYQIPLLLGQRVAQITSAKAGADADGINTSPVGAGPFKVTELKVGSHAYFEKNPDYWNAANIKIDKVELSFGIDGSTIVSSLETGVYDFASLDPSQIQAAQDAKLDVIYQPGYNAANVSINSAKAPFDDPAVVLAVRHAINRDEFIDKVTFKTGTKTDQPFPAGYVAYDDSIADLWPYDPVKAKQILADAGYKENDPRLAVDFVVSAAATANEIVQSQLAAIGITAKLKVDTNWATPFFAKDLALSTYSTTGRESPVQTLTAHFGPKGPLNLSGPFTAPQFQAAVKVARETPLDSPDYAKNLKAATRAGVQNTPTVFTYSQPNIFVKTPRISALPAIPGQVHWEGVTIKPE